MSANLYYMLNRLKLAGSPSTDCAEEELSGARDASQHGPANTTPAALLRSAGVKEMSRRSPLYSCAADLARCAPGLPLRAFGA
jgi:hypothetical protein